MGITETIPGVSGGTIAFITGIYDRLIAAIMSIGPGLLNSYKKGGVKKVWEDIDGNFIVVLGTGMAIGIIVGVFSLTYLLEHYPPVIWGFFFALILFSSWYILKMIPNLRARDLIIVVAGALISFLIVSITPAAGSENVFYIIFSGMLAISALMLPGISGSFILLILGMWSTIIPAMRSVLSSFDIGSIKILFIFGIGVLLGVMVFSRILTWVLNNYRRFTFLFLIGFMLGSLRKIWPWREALSFRENSKGEIVPLKEAMVLPSEYSGDPLILWVTVVFVLGGTILFLLAKYNNKNFFTVVDAH